MGTESCQWQHSALEKALLDPPDLVGMLNRSPGIIQTRPGSGSTQIYTVRDTRKQSNMVMSQSTASHQLPLPCNITMGWPPPWYSDQHSMSEIARHRCPSNPPERRSPAPGLSPALQVPSELVVVLSQADRTMEDVLKKHQSHAYREIMSERLARHSSFEMGKTPIMLNTISAYQQRGFDPRSESLW